MYWTQEVLRDHYENPRNKGRIEDADFYAERSNPTCGDRILFTGTIRNGIILSVNFEGSGCVISIATASLLTTAVLNQPYIDILSYDSTFIEKLINIQLGPVRFGCAMLALSVLQDGLRMYHK